MTMQATIVDDMSRFIVVELPAPATPSERKRIAERIASAFAPEAPKLPDMYLAGDLEPGDDVYLVDEVHEMSLSQRRAWQDSLERSSVETNCTGCGSTPCVCDAIIGPQRTPDEPSVSDTVERALRSIAGGIMSGQEAAHIANNALRELITRRLAQPPEARLLIECAEAMEENCEHEGKLSTFVDLARRCRAAAGERYCLCPPCGWVSNCPAHKFPDRAASTKSAKCALKGCDNDAPLGGVCAAHETSGGQP